MESKIYNQSGKEVGKMKLPEGVFGLPWNADMVHDVVRLMNNNSRDNIAHTKTRGEVRGGGKKPWQQKGTGRARHGSTRSPIWVGGGIAHGPRNSQNYSRKINKKVRSKALFTILSRKFKDGQILFLDAVNMSTPKAKDAKTILSSLAGIKGYEKLATKSANAAIIAMDTKSSIIEKSFRNFGNVSVEEFRNINPVSVMNHTYLIIANPEQSLKAFSAKVESTPKKVSTMKATSTAKTTK
jgi:large subunit ribosomal protein L4